MIGAWLVLAAILFGLGRLVDGSFVDDFRVPDADSQRALDLTREHFSTAGEVSADVVFHAPNGPVRDHAGLIEAMLADVGKQPHVTSALDPIRTGMVSADGRTALASVQYAGPTDELGTIALDKLRSAAEPVRAAGVQVEFRGWVVEQASRPKTGLAEMVGLVAAALVLLLAFGSVVAAGLPIVTALVGLGTGSMLVLLVGSVVNIPSSAPIVAVMLGLGAGIDYALFLVTRYRQHVLDGLEVTEAIARATATSGKAVLFAGGTVVVAILGLYAAGIPFVGAMGLASALIVAVMVLAALTLLPALLAVVGKRIDTLRVLGGRRKTDRDGWLRWGQHVRGHRWLYAIGATLVLLVLTVPLLSLRLGMPDDRVQPQTETRRQAYDLIARSFGPGYNGPMLIAVELAGTDRSSLGKLAEAVKASPGVAVVTPPRVSEDGQAGLITVIPRSAPQDAETTDLVHRLRETVLPDVLKGTQAHVGGATPLMIDMADRVAERLPWVVGGVVAVSFLLLVLMFRSILVPIKAAVLTLLSIGAAYGVIVAIFQWGWGLSLIGVPEPVPIMSVVPMFLFAVLFGLSMDYEVFLMAKVREDYLADGDAYRGVVTGLAATGRVITSAAAIMAVVFLSFVGIDNPLVKMVGIGLAVAVIVDATVIRMMLVPAIMSLLGRAAWWFPGRGR